MAIFLVHHLSCNGTDVTKSEMSCVELHNGIQKIIEGYHRIGLWHRGDETTVNQTRIKILFSMYSILFPISLIAGSILTDNKYESMFLIETAIICTVVLMRLLYIMWRQKEICELLHRIGVYTVKDEKIFTEIDSKLKSFMKWITYFYYYVTATATCVSLVLPIIGSDKKLFFNIGFPLDYKNNDFSYWVAFLFVFTEVYMLLIAVTFSIIIWYLLFNCGLKYKVLGNELENMGVVRTVDPAARKRKLSAVEKRHFFNRDLINGIKSHKDINESTERLEWFLSELFSVQLATSAACICASIYVLAFNNSANFMEYQIYIFYLIYNICDIFMVMYFGNEIEVASDGLSYCLFQSNWMEQPQSCKLIIIIFGERLKQAQQLVILKLYPLNLETFTRILNGAYSMFNILKTVAV